MLGVVRFNTICKLCHSGFKKSKISSNPGRWILKNIRNANATYSFEPQMEISTTVIALKRRKTAEERKAPRIIEYPSKAKGEFVGVWRNITLRELAKVLNTNLAYVNSIFLDQIKDPDMPLDDLILIQQAIRRSGRRMITVARPTNEVKEFVDKDVYPRPPPLKSDLKPRPPVVTVMGHVDHGKTTLLDALRASNVVDQEFGGITQHIGAFTVMVGNMQSITFLDTPGHAAFSAMRERGANVTDIVVLVVAADDGVMEQTLESIRMARNANVPIIVAINKIDSPKANIERTKKMLMEVGIQIESMGGDVQAVPISALKKQNLNQLVETILLQADILGIGGDPTGLVEAVIIESKTHPHRGKQCSLVVQRGTLKKGDILVAGTAVGKVRSLRDADGKMLHQVVPGYPAEMDGWRELPPAGELVLQVETEKRAKEVSNYREMQKEERRMEEEGKIIGEKQAEENKIYKDQLEHKRKLGKFKLKREGPRKPEIVEDRSGIPVLSLIVRADVDGTLEAILDVLSTYNSAQCKFDIVSFGVGGITENDMELAELFNAIIYAFNVETVPSIKTSLDSAKVTIKSHNVIYKLIDDIKEEINERLPLVEFEDILGEAKVLQEFEINIGRKKVPVAGCKCTNGVLKKKAQYKLIRNGDVIYTGLLTSMKHLKDEADVIKTEMECGLQLSDSSVRYQKDDIIVCFEIKQLKQTTEWDPGF